MPLTEADISKQLYLADAFTAGDRVFRVMFLLPESLWRPLKVSWWRGKEVSIIGGDENGNYILRHADGSVRLWDHTKSSDLMVASSVGAFMQALKPFPQ